MRRTPAVIVAAALVVTAAAVGLAPDRPPPARVWALEAPDAEGLPMPVRIALTPGGDAIDDFDLARGCGGGGMGGTVTHFLTVRRSAVSRLLDVVRDPTPVSLGYRRRRHTVTTPEGEWRELVMKSPDGSDPPIPGGDALAGAWEHVVGDGRACALVLRADGTLDVAGGEGQGDWTVTGSTLVLNLEIARDGRWPTGDDRAADDATCEVSGDRTAWAGTDRLGRAVRGYRAPAR